MAEEKPQIIEAEIDPGVAYVAAMQEIRSLLKSGQEPAKPYRHLLATAQYSPQSLWDRFISEEPTSLEEAAARNVFLGVLKSWAIQKIWDPYPPETVFKIHITRDERFAETKEK